MGEVGRSFTIQASSSSAAAADAAPLARLVGALRAEGLTVGDAALALAQDIYRSNLHSRARMGEAVFLDADGGMCVSLPLTGEALELFAVAAARVRGVLPELAEPGFQPHITLLYAGAVTDRQAFVERAQVVLRTWPPVNFWVHGAGLFQPSEASEGRWPVVLRVGDFWTLEAMANALLRACAHLVESPQFPAFCAHATVGYLDRAPTELELAQLAALEMPHSEWPPRLVVAEVSGGEGQVVEQPLAAVLPGMMAG